MQHSDGGRPGTLRPSGRARPHAVRLGPTDAKRDVQPSVVAVLVRGVRGDLLPRERLLQAAGPHRHLSETRQGAVLGTGRWGRRLGAWQSGARGARRRRVRRCTAVYPSDRIPNRSPTHLPNNS